MTRLKIRGRGIARRLERGDDTVATILQLANGRWSLCDTQERPVTKRSFATPRAARDWFLDNEREAQP